MEKNINDAVVNTLTAFFDVDKNFDEHIASRYLFNGLKDVDATENKNTLWLQDFDFLFNEYVPVTNNDEILDILRLLLASIVCYEDYKLLDNVEGLNYHFSSVPNRYVINFKENEKHIYKQLKELTEIQLGAFIAVTAKKYFISRQQESYVQAAAESYLYNLQNYKKANNTHKIETLLILLREAYEIGISKEYDANALNVTTIVALCEEMTKGSKQE